jgi:aryl-alcohol dehydrogenase-like predicted oxidoreductase
LRPRSSVAPPATGFADRPSQLVRADILDAIDKSLAKLGTDYIDLYQIHWPERDIPWGANPTRVGAARRPDSVGAPADETPISETLAVFEDLVKAGKIRHFGLSNESSWGVMRFLAESASGVGPRVASLQNAYNLVNRTFEVNLAEVFAPGPRLFDRQIRPWRPPAGLAVAAFQSRPTL